MGRDLQVKEKTVDAGRFVRNSKLVGHKGDLYCSSWHILLSHTISLDFYRVINLCL